jgi:hypothetical protein
MHRNTMIGLAALSGVLVLLAAAIPAVAQSTNGMPMHQGAGMMDMHSDQVSHMQPGPMQLFHEQMPPELSEQMQAWHQQQSRPARWAAAVRR